VADQRARRRLPSTSLALVLVLVSAAGASTALGAPGKAVFAVKPQAPHSPRGYFVLAGAPGQELGGSVLVSNVGRRSGRVDLYPVDATTGQTSGAVYRGPGAARRDVGAWLRLSRSSLTLAPGASEAVAFTLGIPEDASPGQHLGGIVAAPAAPSAVHAGRRGKQSFSVRIQEQAIIAVEADLPGAVQRRMAITSLAPGRQPGYQTLLIGLANQGNVLQRGRGRITVRDDRDRRVLDQRFALDTFVPRTAIGFPLRVSGKALPAGSYMGTVAVAYGTRRVVRTLPFSISAGEIKQVFGFHPPAGPRNGGGGGTSAIVLIGGAIALILLSAGATLVVIRFRSRSAKGSPPSGSA
jgi:hypothetical protein